MEDFSLKENVIYSYRTFFRLAGRTFFARGNPQARLTARRCLVMIRVSIRLFVVETVHWIAFAPDETLYVG